MREGCQQKRSRQERRAGEVTAAEQEGVWGGGPRAISRIAPSVNDRRTPSLKSTQQCSSPPWTTTQRQSTSATDSGVTAELVQCWVNRRMTEPP